jgi:hypothetical protein
MSIKEKINNMFGKNGDGLRTMPSIDEMHLLNECKPEPPESPAEEWIWVDGYKGTNSDMTCREYQYELHKQYDIEEDTVVKECENGFHLCLTLEDVFKYYSIGYGHRYFRVKALVRKDDYDTYGAYISSITRYDYGFYRNKLAAKSIIFTEEVSGEELLKTAIAYDDRLIGLSPEYIEAAFKMNVDEACISYASDTLVADGYSKTFAEYLVRNHPTKFQIARAVASLEDLSMDMKVLSIMYDLNKEKTK